MSLSKVDDEDKQIVTDGGISDEPRTDDVTESRRINNGEAMSSVDRLDLPLVSQPR